MGFDAAGRIRQLLAERGWSIYRLAEQAHIPQSTLSNMFSRGNQPSLATLELICDALGITLAQFFAVGGEETTLSARQQAVLSAWDGLSPSQQEALLQLLDTMHP